MDVTKLDDRALELLVTSAREELRRRAETGTDPWTAVIGQEFVKRAILVAAVQGETVLLWGPRGTGKSMLARCAASVGVAAVELLCCPCGYFTDPRHACRCTAETLTEWTRTVLSPAADRANLHVEVPPVPTQELLDPHRYRGTTIENVKAQLAAVKPPLPELWSEAATHILKAAASELGLSAKALSAIRTTARSIAGLAGHTRIEADSACEAIHYRRLDRSM